MKASVNRNVKGGGQGNSDLFPGLSSGGWLVLPRRQLQIRSGIFLHFSSLLLSFSLSSLSLSLSRGNFARQAEGRVQGNNIVIAT